MLNEEAEMEAKIRDSEIIDAIDKQREEQRLQALVEAEEFKKLSSVLQRSKTDALPRPTSFSNSCLSQDDRV